MGRREGERSDAESIIEQIEVLAAGLVDKEGLEVDIFRVVHDTPDCEVTRKGHLIMRIIEVGASEGLPGAILTCETHNVSSHPFYTGEDSLIR